ncbi:OLC1v1032854C5 [Oldenlandia corymbosa var. corymbosa]|nr:OLC1v1032854C5 [Oldenlandia corymbosa var. corymbosa]
MSVGDFSAVLEKLSTLIVAEANLLGGLQQKIQGIIDELDHMKAFLMFAEGREEEDPMLRVCISQVREVAYDIEDVVADFLRCFDRHYGYGFFGHARKIFNSIKNLYPSHQIAEEIQAIKSRITNISATHRRYQSEYGTFNQLLASSSSSVNDSLQDYRNLAGLVDEAKLVGIDRPKQQLISQLLDGDSQFKVVSVVGMGGIGKTTLVRKVQEDAHVKKEFQIFTWVTASQTWDLKELLRVVIKQLYKQIKKSVPEEVASITNASELHEHVTRLLQNKRYLMVFDDVWDPNFWHFLKFALSEGNCGNRVIITTRNAGVGNATNGEFQSYVHTMEPLSFEDSWTLFCKKVFRGNSCPVHLKSTAEGILKKSRGLPLAIAAIGGLLGSKGTSKIDEWKLVERGLGGEDLGGELELVKKSLFLSYQGLPYHLKTCLLYASIFPEDKKIIERRLIRFWIAEGLVQEKAKMTKHEIARAYLKELSSRSLIQVTHPHDPSPREYHIHDLLREVICSKSTAQNFATIVAGDRSSLPNKLRRLAVHDLRTFGMMPGNCFKYLRSLVIFDSKEPLPKHLLSRMLCNGSRILKVLDLEGTQLEEIPEEVFRLVNLKFLNLSKTRVKVIPKSIGSLKNLMYLDLRKTYVTELPKEILKIEGLIHLMVSSAMALPFGVVTGFKGPKNIARLRSLEFLYQIEANEVLIREIRELKQLKGLGIYGLRRADGKQLCSSLGNLFNLEDLYLQALGDHEVLDLEVMNISLYPSLRNLQLLSVRGCLQKVPQIIPLLHELTVLDLGRSGLMENPLESLQYLPNLESLILNEAFRGESLCFKAGSFPKLEKLWLWRMHNLKWMNVEEGAMPNLGQLNMRCLRVLEEFPWGIQHLIRLQVLYLDDLSDKVIAQMQDHDVESQGYQNISHISKILIWDEQDGWCRHPQYWKTRKAGPQ